jgi:PAS domain S-box-containing protein
MLTDLGSATPMARPGRSTFDLKVTPFASRHRRASAFDYEGSLPSARWREAGDTPAGAALAPKARPAADWVKAAEEAAGLGHWRLDVATLAIAWSDGLFALYGLQAGDLPALASAMAAIHPDDSAEANRLLERAIQFGEDYTSQVRLKRADGSWRVLTNRTVCKRNEAGAPETVYGVVMDVTDVELALRASEARYRALAENGNDIIIQSGLDDLLTYVSPSCTAVTGYTPEELVGSDTTELVDKRDLPDLDLAVSEALEQPSRTPRCVEYRIRHKDGRELWLEGRPTRLIDSASGEVVGTTDVIRDITERKALELALIAKCEEAEASARAKAEFLANMSHEIRTPLTAILGFAGLLQDFSGPADAAQEYVRLIRTAGEQLLGVVNDVLDFSRLDAGQLQLDPRPVDPAALVAETAELLRGQAQAKGLELEVVVAPGTPRGVSLDAGRVRQVLLNLIGNAVKFTPSGTVIVSLAASGKGALKLTVADTGPGVPVELQGRLFERFSQVDGSISRHHGGAGLGLAICKGLVELMGGAIGVGSAAGQGSTFWFTIAAPLARQPELAPEPQLAAPAALGHILLVDDVAVNRLLVRAMLEPLGYTFEEASCGAHAVAAAVQRPFDLILMDLQMPGMGGLEATRAIRSAATINRTTPILALSASVLAREVAECRAAGMNGHLAKPIIPGDLVGAVAQWTRTRREHLARLAAIGMGRG